MRVDVVVCAKNRAVLLERALRQIIKYVPFENLIVIYGSSRDNTKEIAEKYATQVFWDGDKGLGAARALGIEKATSEIVAMIDSDVILTREWFQHIIKPFKNQKVAAVTGTCIFGYGCKPLESLWEYIRRTASVYIGCNNVMFRRKAILEVGNFNKEITGAGEDYELYYRIIKAGYQWKWVKEAVVYHPMNMLEFLKHIRWWVQGRAFIDGSASQALSSSRSRVYSRLAYSILESLWNGVKLSVAVHPALFLYSPLMNAIRVWEELKALAKMSNFHKEFGEQNTLRRRFCLNEL